MQKSLLLASIFIVLLIPFTYSGFAKNSKCNFNINYPYKLTSTAPNDINSSSKACLEKNKELNKIQRMFEIFSWKKFISLNWPVDIRGRPRSKLSDKGDPIWNGWKESYEVFQSNGATPSPWGIKTKPDNIKKSDQSISDIKKYLTHIARHNLYGGENIIDETNQAFTGPIWDQNGNILRYEILMNKTEFDYIVKNELYNIEGQVKFSKNNSTVVFPSAQNSEREGGQYQSATKGVIEIKIAWKIIDEKHDIKSRFFRQHAMVIDENGNYSKRLVGMVGMHIALKTKSSPQWIWTTFEHIDNLEANSLISVKGKTLKPLFYDPNCQICPVNVFPNLKGDYTQEVSNIKRNQIKRTLPITKETQDLNSNVQALLEKNNSVLRYYQLIGTQWPTQPTAPPYAVKQHNNKNPPKLPMAVTNKSGGKPTPVYLTNMMMETYFQGATTPGIKPALYNTRLENIQAWHQIQGAKTYGTNTKRIFGTESCIGCHYSSSIATEIKTKNGKKTVKRGNPASADFSWLISQKAHFKN